MTKLNGVRFVDWYHSISETDPYHQKLAELTKGMKTVEIKANLESMIAYLATCKGTGKHKIAIRDDGKRFNNLLLLRERNDFRLYGVDITYTAEERAAMAANGIQGLKEAGYTVKHEGNYIRLYSPLGVVNRQIEYTAEITEPAMWLLFVRPEMY